MGNKSHNTKDALRKAKQRKIPRLQTSIMERNATLKKNYKDIENIVIEMNDELKVCIEEDVVGNVPAVNEVCAIYEEDDSEIFASWDPGYQHQLISKSKESTKFFETECCSRKCNAVISEEDAKLFRMEALSLDYSRYGVNVLDTVLLGIIRTIYNDKNPGLQYRIHELPVCQKMFMFVHCLSVKRLNTILQKYKSEGINGKLQSSDRKLTFTGVPLQKLQEVINYLRNYAAEQGSLISGTADNKQVLKLLPHDERTCSMYDKYVELYKLAGCHPISPHLFNRIWLTYCPDIVRLDAKRELCTTCKESSSCMPFLAGTSTKEKLAFHRECEEHLHIIIAENEIYEEAIEESRSKFRSNQLSTSLRGSYPANSYDGIIHVSFAFDQEMHLPSDPQLPSSANFLSLYRVGVFGIMCNTDMSQINYLIPESLNMTKSSNFVISYLHEFLNTRTYGEKHLHLLADSHLSRSKSNSLLLYLAWRIANNYNQTIKLSFVSSGHSELHCSKAFDLIKLVSRRCAPHDLDDIVEIINRSSSDECFNSAVPTGSEAGESFIDVYNWSYYFAVNRLRPVGDISMFAHFLFSNDGVGLVNCFTDINDSGVVHELFTAETKFQTDAPKLISVGVPEDRAEYLYKNVRKYCNEKSRDKLCPRPFSVHRQCPTVSSKKSCSIQVRRMSGQRF